MLLRDYQERAIDLVRQAMIAGHRRVVLVAPTGSGKTRIAAAIVARALAKGSRVLWLTHRIELVRQSYAALADLGLNVGAIAATEPHLARNDAPVQVCSLQTLLARDQRPPAQLIVADECHHFSEDGAETWSSLLDGYPGVPIVGLTATPERGDGCGLAPMFDGLVVGSQPRPLIAAGHLVPCEILRPNRVLDPGELAKDPCEAFLAYARDRQAILFARTIELAVEYADRISAAGIVARSVHESTPPDERSLAVREFREGHVRVLTNVYVLTEGTDLPMASCCILARGASKPGIYLQMVGRVLRPHAGKRDALLIDLRGVSHVHGPPEDERLYSLDGKAIMRASRKCPVCGQERYGEPPHNPCKLQTCAELGVHCPDCGFVPSGDAESVEDVIVNEPLAKYARKLAEGPEQRRETLLRWAREYMRRCGRPGAAWHKFRAVYGEDPDPRWWQEVKYECRDRSDGRNS